MSLDLVNQPCFMTGNLRIDPQTKQVTVTCVDRLVRTRTRQFLPGIQTVPQVLQMDLEISRGICILDFCASFLADRIHSLARSGLEEAICEACSHRRSILALARSFTCFFGLLRLPKSHDPLLRGQSHRLNRSHENFW